MEAFRFGELAERSLHRQLKAHYCPPDGITEHPVGRYLADIWSPTMGIIEIQTGSLGKLRPKLRAYLGEGPVTVVHPVGVRKTIVTWNADRSQVIRQRLSPRKGRIETLFREIGSLTEFLPVPGFCLRFCLVHEKEHRSDDGQGSWRRRGISRFDRDLETIEGEREFRTRDEWAVLLPAGWQGPSTNQELGALMGLSAPEVQSLTSCFKKLGILTVAGKSGRADLLVRSPFN